MVYVGSSPVWSSSSYSSSPPWTTNNGVDLRGSVKTIVSAHLKQNPDKFGFLFVVQDVPQGQPPNHNVSLTINGIEITKAFDEFADVYGFLHAFKLEIDNDATLSSTVDCVIVYTDDENEALYVYNKDRNDLNMSVDLDANGSDMHIRKDSTTASIRVWLLADDNRWVMANDGEFEDISHYGMTERLSTAGFRKIYIQVYDADGHVDVRVGPAYMS